MNSVSSKIPLLLLATAVLASVSACGGSGGGDHPNPPVHPISRIESGDMFTGKPYIFRIAERYRAPEYELSAKYGVITDKNPVTGEQAEDGVYYYYVPENTLNTLPYFYGFTEEITISDGEHGLVEFLELGTDAENGDPLFTDQWHLKNLGQNPFSVTTSPSKGKDLNVISAWHLKDSNNELISGKGVKVSVLDTPVDVNHEELKARMYTPSGAKSYVNSGLTLKKLQKSRDYAHGTCVAGIIGASASNGKGGRGVAYESSLTSYDYDSGFFFNEMTDKAVNNVVNASIGWDYSHGEGFDPNLELWAQAMFENGIPFIKAAGNEFDEVLFFHSYYYPLTCKDLNVNCQFNQTSSLNRGRYFINVSALNSLGVKSSYSSVGSHVWVAGFSGEFGYRKDGKSSSAAIVTSLSSYLPEEFSDWDKNVPWRTEEAYYDKRKFYTQRMNGTSAATPMVTGVTALIIQAKPDVTVSQVRYILAKTSNNDKTEGWETLAYDPIESYVSQYGENITLENAWHDNASGLRFSNYYGFGVVNAANAVKKALACDDDAGCKLRSELPEVFISTRANPCESPDGGLTTVCTLSDFVNADNPGEVPEAFEIDNLEINVGSLMYVANSESDCTDAANDSKKGVARVNNLLQISMTSPGGTESLIKSVYANWDFSGTLFKQESADPFLISTSDFFTEMVPSTGSFKLKIRSICPIDVDELNNSVYVQIDGYALD